MTNTIASKIAANVNASRNMGGVIVADINTGESCWYSDDSRPAVGADELVISIPAGKMSRAKVLAIYERENE